jgi:hypothetical protein
MQAQAQRLNAIDIITAVAKSLSEDMSQAFIDVAMCLQTGGQFGVPVGVSSRSVMHSTLLQVIDSMSRVAASPTARNDAPSTNIHKPPHLLKYRSSS